MLRTVYFGNCVQYIERLAKLTDLRAVVVQTSDHSGRTSQAIETARARQAAVLRPSHPKLAHALVLDSRPDLIVVGHYDRLIPEAVYGMAPAGAINIHPSLLPRYRGQHVVNWALVNGESETGVSIHYLAPEYDTGALIAQRRIPIEEADDAASVTGRLVDLGAAMLEEVLNRFARGVVTSVPQDESLQTRFRARTPEDGRLDFHAPPDTIRNLVRALVRPWPGAFCMVRNPAGDLARVTCFRCDILHAPVDPRPAAGEVFDLAAGLSIRHRSGRTIRMTDYCVDGRPIEVGSRVSPEGQPA